MRRCVDPFVRNHITWNTTRWRFELRRMAVRLFVRPLPAAASAVSTRTRVCPDRALPRVPFPSNSPMTARARARARAIVNTETRTGGEGARAHVVAANNVQPEHDLLNARLRRVDALVALVEDHVRRLVEALEVALSRVGEGERDSGRRSVRERRKTRPPRAREVASRTTILRPSFVMTVIVPVEAVGSSGVESAARARAQSHSRLTSSSSADAMGEWTPRAVD